MHIDEVIINKSLVDHTCCKEHFALTLTTSISLVLLAITMYKGHKKNTYEENSKHSLIYVLTSK